MGSTNFFAKLASVDPLAQAMDLPGAHKYAQAQAQRDAGATDTNGGAYTGIDPTLAGANAGYRPGGPGATPGFVPTQPGGGNGLFGILQKNANLIGSGAPSSANGLVSGSKLLPGGLTTSNPYVQPNTTRNPYALAAGNAVQNNRGGLYGQ